MYEISDLPGQVFAGVGSSGQEGRVTQESLEALGFVFFRIVVPLTEEQFKDICMKHIPSWASVRGALGPKIDEAGYFRGIFEGLNKRLNAAYKPSYRCHLSGQSVTLYDPRWSPGDLDVLIRPRACKKFASAYFTERLHANHEAAIVHFLNSTGRKELALVKPFYSITESSFEMDQTNYREALCARGTVVSEGLHEDATACKAKIATLSKKDLLFGVNARNFHAIDYAGRVPQDARDPDMLKHVYGHHGDNAKAVAVADKTAEAALDIVSKLALV